MKPLLTKFALLVVSGVLGAMLVEQGYRLYVFGLDAFAPAQLNSMRRLGVSGLLQASDVHEILFELRPNLDTRFKLVPFETNSAGLRDEEHALSRSGETTRIAVVGDSLTMASGVRIEEAYHSKLEQRFNALGDGRRYEFLNFGVGGYSLRQYAAVVEHRALGYSPDLIVIGFTATNDYKIPDPSRFERRYRVRRPSRPFRESFVWSSIQLMRVRAAEEGSEPAAATEEERAYLVHYLGRIGELCRSASVPCVLAYLWPGVSDPGPLPAIARDSGLDFVDTTRVFEGRMPAEFAILVIDGHPDAAGHAMFADALFPTLRNKLAMR